MHRTMTNPKNKFLNFHSSTFYSLVAAVVLNVALGLFTPKVLAESFRGSFEASAQEKSKHVSEMWQFSRTMQECLNADYQHHLNFYRRYGISPFYGSNSSFKRLGYNGRRNFLRSIGKDPNLVDVMKPTSCVGLATKCFERAFNQTGQGAVWARIKRYVAANSYDGSALIDGFRRLGWYVMYWNPDPSQNNAWDSDEKRRNPSNNGTWGYHAYRYSTATKNKKYYMNSIDDAETLVGFGTRPPRVLDDASVFVGVAHAGYHVFPGYKGKVIEAHSTRDIRDANSVESSDFNPIESGGAPRGNYRSGIVAVPPGEGPRASFWPWN